MSDPSAPTPARPRGAIVRALVAISACLAIIVAGSSVYAIATYVRVSNVGQQADDYFDSDRSKDDPTASLGECAEGVCNYLLLGSDSREGLSREQEVAFGTDKESGGGKQADTIMLVHTDPELQKAIILSFPRDLWVNIPDHGEGKINSAFDGGIKGGGAGLMARTIEQLTGLTIDHFLYVDLAGFQGVVETMGGVDMCIPADNAIDGRIVDELTGLDIAPGCQTLPPDQALAWVRTRHLPCDANAPDFFRIARQQQFMRALVNRLVEPDQLAKLPGRVQPVLASMSRDKGLNPADLAYLVGQLRGISTGAAEFRAVPAYGDWVGTQSVVRMDPSAKEIFTAIRQGRQIGDVGTESIYTPPSEANVRVPVVNDGAGSKAAEAEQRLSDAGFDISPGIVAVGDYPTKTQVKGTVIAFAPGQGVRAQVVARYFPGVPIREVKGMSDDVALFITPGWKGTEVGGTPAGGGDGGGGSSGPSCIDPTG
jgi:LCP family protein required for cell wall assembly